MGRKLFKSFRSAPGFLIGGVSAAVFGDDGTTPVGEE